MICGGIDLGGTKIEARLFDGAGAQTQDIRRCATPRDSYDNLLDALTSQINWLITSGGAPDMPIGIALPGIIDPDSGISHAANTQTQGHAIEDDLRKVLNRSFTVVNDCMAFALSEANGGAGDGAASVVGLVLGTGVGAGVCYNQQLLPRHGGLAVEIGHVALPASAVKRHGLPLLACGCGRLGCMETYVSGTGLASIAEQTLGQRLSGEALVADDRQDVLAIWEDITGECLVTLQLTLAPTCIVLGGGLSNLPDVAARLSRSMQRHAFVGAPLPKISVARHGDSSGARGAALLACAT